MPKQEWIDRAATAAALFGGARDVVDEAAAATIGISRTDLRVLSAVAHAPDGLSAGALATEVALSPASTTESVQRLAARGLLVRSVDPADRRRALIVADPSAEAIVNAVYDPLRAAGHELLQRYSESELRLIVDFLERGRAFQLGQAARIRGLDSSAWPG